MRSSFFRAGISFYQSLCLPCTAGQFIRDLSEALGSEQGSYPATESERPGKRQGPQSKSVAAREGCAQRDVSQYRRNAHARTAGRADPSRNSLDAQVQKE